MSTPSTNKAPGKKLTMVCTATANLFFNDPYKTKLEISLILLLTKTSRLLLDNCCAALKFSIFNDCSVIGVENVPRLYSGEFGFSYGGIV